MNEKLAFFTCYFGGSNNYSRLIPPLPSTRYHCYFFTNDIELYNSLDNTAWIRVLCDNRIHDCDLMDTMETKELRCCPHRFPALDKYEYLCWSDSKLLPYEDKVELLMSQLEGDNSKFIVLSKHPYSNTFNSVWDEFNLVISSEKYGKQAQQNTDYINRQISNGFSEKIDIHFCGGWKLIKRCQMAKDFGDEWYSHVLECGIEDQISLSFIQQKYIEHIIPVEYQETWKYFYE